MKNKKTKIFILAGQSNMQGCGKLEHYVKDSRILNFKNGIWQTAEHPLHNYSCKLWPDGGYGLATAFGTKLLKNNPAIQIGFIPCAVSGSKLSQWQPDAELFNNTVTKTQRALNIISGELCGILWHQGEANSKNLELTKNYQANMGNIINGFRTSLGNDKLPFIAGLLGDFLSNNPDYPYYNVINKAIEQEIAQLQYTSCVSSEQLTDKDRNDYTHFDSRSLKIFGERYAKAYLSLLKTCYLPPLNPTKKVNKIKEASYEC